MFGFFQFQMFQFLFRGRIIDTVYFWLGVSCLFGNVFLGSLTRKILQLLRSNQILMVSFCKTLPLQVIFVCCEREFLVDKVLLTSFVDFLVFLYFFFLFCWNMVCDFSFFYISSILQRLVVYSVLFPFLNVDQSSPLSFRSLSVSDLDLSV